jgi:hypothetical protein
MRGEWWWYHVGLWPSSSSGRGLFARTEKREYDTMRNQDTDAREGA